MAGTRIAPTEQSERARIGATVRQIREMRGFSPDQFANEVNISRPYLANIEAGRKPLTEVLLARFSSTLDVRPLVIVRADYFELEHAVSA